MARAYSDDLRRKLLEAHAAGKGTLGELAERFGVSVGWAWKISAAHRETGSTVRAPQRRAGSRVPVERVRALIQARPDMVLRELVEAMAEAGHPFSQAHLWRVLRGLGLRLKKSRSTPPNATPRPTGSGVRSSSKLSGRSRRKT